VTDARHNGTDEELQMIHHAENRRVLREMVRCVALAQYVKTLSTDFHERPKFFLVRVMCKTVA
jgi:hypothetical protein